MECINKVILVICITYQVAHLGYCSMTDKQFSSCH